MDLLLADGLPCRNPLRPLVPSLQLCPEPTPAPPAAAKLEGEKSSRGFATGWMAFILHLVARPQLRLGLDTGGDFLLFIFLIGAGFAPSFLAWTVFLSLFLGDDSTISSLEGSSCLGSL